MKEHKETINQMIAKFKTDSTKAATSAYNDAVKTASDPAFVLKAMQVASDAQKAAGVENINKSE